MRSQWGAIAKPHAKVLDLQHPQVPPLGHDPSNRKKKILFNISSFICGTRTKFGIKIFENDMVIEI